VIKMLVSITAVYAYDNTIFDELSIPQGMSKQTLVRNMLRELAELNLVYSDPEILKMFIRDWSAEKVSLWGRLWELAETEYNPIENYNRYEENDFTHGKQTTDTLNTTVQDNGGIHDKVYGFNSETATNQDERNTNNTEHTTGTNTRANSGTDRERIHQYGNIGVTTSQQMAEQELALRPKLDIYKYIIEEFKQEFCILIY